MLVLFRIAALVFCGGGEPGTVRLLLNIAMNVLKFKYDSAVQCLKQCDALNICI